MLVRRWLFVLSGLVAIFAIVFFTKYRTVVASEATSEKIGDWVIRCENEDTTQQKSSKKTKGKKSCNLIQELILEKDDKKNVLAIYQIGYFGTNQIKFIQLVPLKVSLQAGTSLVLDGKKLIAPGKYAFCDAGGCHVATELSNSDLSEILSAKEIVLGLINVDGKQINLPFSAKGLKDGLDKIKSVK